MNHLFIVAVSLFIFIISNTYAQEVFAPVPPPSQCSYNMQCVSYYKCDKTCSNQLVCADGTGVRRKRQASAFAPVPPRSGCDCMCRSGYRRQWQSYSALCIPTFQCNFGRR